MKTRLQQKYSNISFNAEEHRYTVNNKIMISVTQLLKKYTPPFDIDGSITAKHALKNGITPREQADLWKAISEEACLKGTETHQICEDMLKGTYTYPKTINVDYNALIRLLHPVCEEIKQDLLATEQIIYNESLGIAGTIDILSIQDNKILIGDWKTNGKDIIIDKSYGTLLPPLNHVPNNDYYKYALQLSLYRYLLELDGFVCKEQSLLHIRETEVKEIPVIYLKEEIEMILKEMRK